MNQFYELFSAVSKAVDNMPDYYYIGAAILFAIIVYFTVKR